MLKLLRSGDEGPYCKLYEEDQRYLQHTRRVPIPALSYQGDKPIPALSYQGDKPAMGL